MKNIILALSAFIISSTAFAQEPYDCSRYSIIGVTDTVYSSQASVYLTLTTDNNPVGTGYTDLFFVDQFNDTLNVYDNWGSWLPCSSCPNGDTISYFLAYDSAIKNFPKTFDGYLVTRNPNCEIPFNYAQFVSVVEKQKHKELKVYPNPTNDVLEIYTVSRILSITVKDINGKQLMFKEESDNRVKLDISSLKRGTYIVLVKTHEEEIKKIIIKN